MLSAKPKEHRRAEYVWKCKQCFFAAWKSRYESYFLRFCCTALFGQHDVGLNLAADRMCWECIPAQKNSTLPKLICRGNFGIALDLKVGAPAIATHALFPSRLQDSRPGFWNLILKQKTGRLYIQMRLSCYRKATLHALIASNHQSSMPGLQKRVNLFWCALQKR